MAAAYQLHRIKPQVSTVYCSPIFHDIFIKNYEWLQLVVLQQLWALPARHVHWPCEMYFPAASAHRRAIWRRFWVQHLIVVIVLSFLPS